MKEFIVHLVATPIVQASVIVEAETLEDAKVLALESADAGEAEWDWDGRVLVEDSIEVSDVEEYGGSTEDPEPLGRDGCESNQCEQIACHRCFPRLNCTLHTKCEEFTKDTPEDCLNALHPDY